MISYDSYKNRIEKVAKVKAFVVRFKFLIIGVLAVLIAGVTALLATKGMVTVAMSLPAQITYGDDYAPTEASAFLSSVSYEYALKGTDEWTEDKPLKVGKYLARTVTNQAFGKGYGDPVEFEITKKDAVLSINSDSVTYGNDPDCTLDGIVSKYGDRIVNVNGAYGMPEKDGNFTIKYKTGKLTITDADGNDSSDCYSYEAAEKDILLTQRTINVKLDDIIHTYDGAPVSQKPVISSVTQETLGIEKDEIAFSSLFMQNGMTVAAPENAGLYDIVIDSDSIRITKGAKDVTHLYSILPVTNAALTINRKNLTVKTDSLTETYDGREHTAESFDSEGLVAGHTITPIGLPVSVKNADSVPNMREFNVFKGGADVTANYFISVNYGTLTILKRDITFSSETGEWVYADSVFEEKGYSVTKGELAPGQTLNVIGGKTVKDYTPTPVSNVLTYEILHNGENVTANYNVAEEWGTLTVKRRPVKITTADNEKIYDGAPLTSAGFTPEEFSANSGLISTHSAKVSGNKTEIVNASVEKDRTLFRIYDGFGYYASDVTSNYEITYNYGTLKVLKRDITVKLNDYSAVYGESYAYDSGSGNYDDAVFCDLASGETLEILNPVYEFGTTQFPQVRSSAYEVKSSSVKITRYGADTTLNYNVTYLSGSVSITPRDINVKVLYAEKEYDGTPLTSTSHSTSYYFNSAKAGLVNGETLTPVQNTVNGRTDVGTSDNNAEFTANANYVLHYDRTEADLYVYARALTLKSNSNVWTYDGKEHFEEGYTVTNGSLASGQNIFVTSNTKVKNYTSSPVDNSLTFDIKTSNGVSVLANYDLQTTVSGTLTVTKRAIKITTGSKSQEYDGTELSDSELIYNKADLAEGQQITVDGYTSIQNVAETSDGNNAVTYFINVISTGEVTTANYEITEVKGTLTVTPRPLKVRTESDTKVYDGAPLVNRAYTVVYAGNKVAQNEENAFIISGESLTLTGSLPEITEIGSIDNAIPLAEPNSNYKIISREHGKLTVTAREITVKLTDYTVTYGESYAYPTGAGNYDKTVAPDLADGEILEILKPVYEFGTAVYPDVRSKAYSVSSETVKITKDGEDTTKNYKVNYLHGEITVESRVLKLKSNSNAWVYDGEKHRETGYFITEGSIPEGQQIKVTSAAEVKDYTPSAVENLLTYDVLYNGASVMKNYAFTAESGTLTVTQRHIWVETASKTKIYDGSPLSCAEYKTYLVLPSGTDGRSSADGLVGGDKLIIDESTLPSITNVSQSPCENIFSFAVPNDNYVLELSLCVYGVLKINPVNLTVNVDAYERIYGENFLDHPVLGNNLTPNGIGANEYLVITEFAASAEYGEGEYPNVGINDGAIKAYKWEIYKNGALYESYEDGVRVSPEGVGNYSFNFVIGQLNIRKRAITITTLDLEFIYNGKLQTDADVILSPSSGTLAAGQRLALRLPVSGAKDAGVYAEANKHFYGVFTTEGGNVSSNYEITNNFGTITVNRRQITLAADDITDAVYGDTLNHTAVVGGDLLADGESIEISVTYEQNGKTVLAKDAGEYTIKINAAACKFRYSDGTVQQVKNYDITSVEDGALTINKKQITVSLTSRYVDYGDDWLYDTPYSDMDFASVEQALPYSETLDFAVLFRKDGVVTEPKNAGSYYVEIDLTKTAVNGKTDGLKNYVLNCPDTARLTIDRRNVFILPLDVSAVYGEEISYPDGKNNFKYSYASDLTSHLVYNEELELFADLSVFDKPDVGKYRLSSLSAIKCYFDGDEETASDPVYSDGSVLQYGFSNYRVDYLFNTINSGRLTVTPRPIEIELNKAENDGETYGKILSYDSSSVNNFTLLNGNFAYGETLKVEAAFSKLINGRVDNVVNICKDAGDYRYTIDEENSVIYSSNGAEKANGINNYQITCSERTASIFSKHILMSIPDREVDYGEALPWNADVYYPQPQAESVMEYNETLSVRMHYCDWDDYAYGTTTFVTPRSVGGYIVVLYDIRVYDENGLRANASNYDMESEFGCLYINEREITVNTVPMPDFVYGDTVVYNGVAEVGGNGLAYGQRLTVTEVEYYKDGVKLDGAPAEAGEYVVKPVAVEIYENDGVTPVLLGNYKISFGDGAPLVIKAKKIRLTVGDKSFVYDGLPHSFTDYYKAEYIDENGFVIREAELTEEEKASIYVASFKTITNVWESGENEVAFASSGNYEIETVAGRLEITARPVAVYTDSKTWVYDGKPHVYEVIKLIMCTDGTAGLPEQGFVDEYTVNWLAAPVTDVVDKFLLNNVCEILFNDPEGAAHSLAENYDIEYIFGQILVTPRTLTVVTSSADKVYDGNPLYTTAYDRVYYINEDGEEEEGLLNGDAIWAVSGEITEITDVGETKNKTLFEPETSNYKITLYEYGNLRVDVRDITITLSDVGVVYGEQTYPVGKDNYDLVNSGALQNGEKLQVSALYYRGDSAVTFDSARDVGTYGITLDVTKSFVYTGRYSAGTEINGIYNYRFTVNDGTLTISQKRLTVIPYSYEDEIYGDPVTPYSAAQNNFVNAAAQLAYNEKMTVTVNYFDNAGNTVDVGNITTVGEYSIVIDEISLTNEFGDTADLNNYDIVMPQNGLLKVNPRPIYVQRIAVNAVYDGEWHEAREYATYCYYDGEKKAGLVNGDVLEIIESTVTRRLNAGTDEILTEFVIPENYKLVSYVGAKLTVKKREITVILNDIADVEYGSALVYPTGADNFSYADGSLVIVEGEALEIAVMFYTDEALLHSAEPKNAGEYFYKINKNKTTVTGAKDPELANGLSNYNLLTSTKYKTAFITKKDVEITLNAPSTVVYDGNEHEYNDGYSLAGGSSFAYGEKIDLLAVNYSDCLEDGSFAITSVPKNAGRYFIEFDASSSVIGGMSADANYNIVCADGVYFEILKKDIRISVGNDSKVYNGFGYRLDADLITYIGVASSEAVSPTVNYYLNGEKVEEPVNAGIYSIVFDRSRFAVIGGLASNYNIVSSEGDERGSLTIEKRKVTQIKPDDRVIEVPEKPVQPLNDETFSSEGEDKYTAGIISGDVGKLTPFYSYYIGDTQTRVLPEDLNTRGVYRIELSFTEASYPGDWSAQIAENARVLANYDLPEVIQSGRLEITARLVWVKAIYTGGEIVYDGTEIDPSSDEWKDKFSFMHWHESEGEGSEGFVDGLADTLTPVYLFELNGAVTGKPVHAGIYTLTVSFAEEISEDDYYVRCEPIKFTIKQRALKVDLSAFSAQTEYSGSLLFSKYPEKDILALAAVQGFISGEESYDKYALEIDFFNKTLDLFADRDFAGLYDVKASLKSGANYDYYIDETLSVWGSLDISKLAIYVKPVNKSELFNGQTISVGGGEYEIIGGYNGMDTALVGGDVMQIGVTGDLQAPAVAKVVYVDANSTVITNAYGENVTASYDIITRYSSDLGGDYNAASFQGVLKYITRTVHYVQTELTQREFTYTGSKIKLDTDGKILAQAVASADADGFMAGHRFAVKGELPILNVAVYAKWVQVAVYDGNGTDVTRFYNLVLDNQQQSQITVKGVEVNITVSGLDDKSLEKAWNEKDTNILKVSDYNQNWTVLNPELYADSVTGLWENHGCEIVVVKGADGKFTFKVLLYQNGTNGRRTEKSMMYSLNVNLPSSLTAVAEKCPMASIK